MRVAKLSLVAITSLVLVGCSEPNGPTNAQSPIATADTTSSTPAPAPTDTASPDVPPAGNIEFGPSAVRVLGVDSKGPKAVELSIIGPEGARYTFKPEGNFEVTCSQTVEGKEAKSLPGMPDNSIERVRMLCDTKKDKLVGRNLQVAIDFDGFSYKFESPALP